MSVYEQIMEKFKEERKTTGYYPIWIDMSQSCYDALKAELMPYMVYRKSPVPAGQAETFLGMVINVVDGIKDKVFAMGRMYAVKEDAPGELSKEEVLRAMRIHKTKKCEANIDGVCPLYGKKNCVQILLESAYKLAEGGK